MKTKLLIITLLTAIISITTAGTAEAQYIKQRASSASVSHAKLVSRACLGRWEKQRCLKAVSDSNLVMVANYGATLQKKGKKQSLETLKEHCAASTAASNGEYPAYAMQSAYTECANIISDIVEETGIMIDQSHYQLIGSAVLCLSKDRRCKIIESGLRKYSGRAQYKRK